MIDFHMHTTHSHDGISGMEEYIIKAIETGMQAICFTEHADYSNVSFGHKNYNPDAFFREFRYMKEKYGSRMEICAGIELGEPHLCSKELELLSEYPYDFILGSIHWCGDRYFGKALADSCTAKEFFDIYWNEILKAARQGGFDALAHIDLPFRVFQELYYTEEMMKNIFGYLLDRNIVLEINTSSIRRGVNGGLIGRDLLEIYRDCGGKYVTIGSDAHRVEDMGADYIRARKLALECGLKEVIFKERKIKRIEEER